MCHADENIPLKIGNGVTIGHRSVIHGCTIEDVAMWEREGRFDILEWVHPITLGEGHYIYDIWISPKTGDDVWRCPWLRKLPRQDKYICRIHDVKPEHCRKYPKSKKHAAETGCGGFE